MNEKNGTDLRQNLLVDDDHQQSCRTQTWNANSLFSPHFLTSTQVSSSAVSAVCGVLMDDFKSEEIILWHSKDHEETRNVMKQCISHLILQRKPDFDSNWVEKLPEVSQRVEKKLYFSSKSIEE
jgi:hypothetical protein